MKSWEKFQCMTKSLSFSSKTWTGRITRGNVHIILKFPSTTTREEKLNERKCDINENGVDGRREKSVNFSQTQMTHTEKKSEWKMLISFQNHIGAGGEQRVRYASWTFPFFALPPHSPSEAYISSWSYGRKNVSIISVAPLLPFTLGLLCRHHCAGKSSFELIFIFFPPTLTLTVDDDFIFILTILKFIFHSCRVLRHAHGDGGSEERKFRAINSRVEWR